MNICLELNKFFYQMDKQRKASLYNMSVTGYRTCQELYQACCKWLELERGAIYSNGYKEYFENICANLRHPDSQHLAFALFSKLNNLTNMQLFVVLRLLTLTARGACFWDRCTESYRERAKAIFTEDEVRKLFRPGLETHNIGNILQYNLHQICLSKPQTHIKQFFGVMPK